MKMKKYKIIAVLSLLVVLALVIVNHNLLSTADKDKLPETIMIEKDMSLPLGTEANPFVVLEIVPHECMAEIGYMIPGCEPIDMDELMRRGDLLGTYNSYVGTGTPSVATRLDDEVRYRFGDEIQPGDEVSQIDTTLYDKDLKPYSGLPLMDGEDIVISTKSDKRYGVWNLIWGSKTVEGYYEKVEENEGSFQLITTTSESVTVDAEGVETKEILTDYTINFVGKNQGDYRWITAENLDKIETDYTASKIWTERSGVTYYEYKEIRYHHNDDLIQTVFETGSEDVVSQVITVTPYDFMNPDNIALIEQADLIYMHTLSGGDVTMWGELNKEGKSFTDRFGNAITADQAKAMTFADNDMPWPAVMAVMERMSSDMPAGLILDYSTYVSKDKSNNSRKMILMIRQYGPAVFKQLYLDTGLVVESEVQEDGLTTGIYNKDEDTAIIDWEESTFWPDIPNTAPEYLKEYGMKNPTFTAQDEWNMIQDNTFCYMGGNDFLMTFLQERGKETSQNGEAYDYYEDLYGERPTGGLTGPETIKFLLQDISKKRQLKILEVQPCNDFIYGSEGWEVYYHSMFTWFTGDLNKDLTVITMPTWEFISSIEDLNSEYDAIIFGVNQDASNGANKYADDNLNVYNQWGGYQGSLAYTTIGDYVSATTKKDTTGAKTLYTDETMRYSGTDITENKLNELKLFLNSGKPIILDRNFLNRDRTINTNLLDISSNIYKLVQYYGMDLEAEAEARAKETEEIIKAAAAAGIEPELPEEEILTDNSTLFVRGLYQANKLKRALAYETCKIKFDTSDGGTGYPAEYTYTAAADGTITDVNYSPSRNFEYTFKIVGKTGFKYGISLYMDINGDGIYDGSLKESDREESIAEGTSEQVAGIVVRDKAGNIVDANDLYANVVYTVSKELEDTYLGILPWKLEAHKIDNSNCRSSVIKYSALKTSSGNKEQIRVLLMNLTPDMSEPSQFYKNNGAVSYVINSGFINMANMAQFKLYLDCVDEYKVTLEYLTNTQWNKVFGNGAAGFKSDAVNTCAQQISAWKQYLDGYDMIILGFNDDCVYTNNYIYNEGFKYFVDQGKSVILSHDMVRDKSQAKVLLTNFDEQLRQMMGQRRFWTDKIEVNGKEVSLFGDNTKNFTSTLNDGTIVPGYVDNSTRQYIVFGDLGRSDRDSYTRGKWGAGEGVDGATQYVNVINQGQITNYPYKINDVIKIANTHAQNFQLDLEDEDVVVWYGLTDQYSTKYATQLQERYGVKDYSTNTERFGRGVYSSIEGDGRNSFYIYNKGNVTYTGLGHSGKMTDEEVQLFVNTMIAAYRSTAATPKIKITNEDAIINNNNATLYVVLDDSNFDTSGEYLQVKFKVNDTSITNIQNRSYVLEYKDKDGKVIDMTTYKLSDNKTVGVGTDGKKYVERDAEYYFYVPYSEVRANGTAEYQLTLTSSYVNASSETISTEATTHVTVMPMPLFTLN